MKNRDSGVEIARFIVSSLKEQDRVAGDGELRSERPTAGAGANYDVLVAVEPVSRRIGCGTRG